MGNEKSIRCVGIDPAPSNETCVYDPEGIFGNEAFKKLNYAEMYEQLCALKATDQILIGWDAPLTARSNFGDEYKEGDLYRRAIETKWQLKVKDVKGISVLGYAAAPHWTISQYCLGLPNVGGAMGCGKPKRLKLLTEGPARIDEPSVVEVHPAVALWGWLKDTGYGRRLNNIWRYKGHNRERTKITPFRRMKCHYEALKFVWREIDDTLKVPVSVANHDELDAVIAYLLCRLWVDRPKLVEMEGSLAEGAWLLPVGELNN